MKRFLILATLLAAPLALLAPAAAASDSLRLVSLSPAGGTVPGVAASSQMERSNSVEATFEYALVTAPKGKVGIYTTDVVPNPPHTAIEWPIWVEKGKGTVKTRFSVSCGSSVHISRVRFALFEQAPGGPQGKTLVENFQDVKYDFVCVQGSTPEPKTPSR
jgi:hypothetical protein